MPVSHMNASDKNSYWPVVGVFIYIKFWTKCTIRKRKHKIKKISGGSNELSGRNGVGIPDDKVKM